MTPISPEEITTALELLDNVGPTVNTIAINLEANRLDRRSFRKYLCDYAERAASDGQLINASRGDTPQCSNRGLLLAYSHMELICWLAANNYTISSTSVKWYSWRKIYSKYRLPFLQISPQKSHLPRQLQNIKNIADRVYGEVDAKNIPFLQDSVKYRKVSLCTSVDPPPGMDDLVHRATLAHKQLSQ
ncbi:hypothetical protein N7455_008381 [Penicillium solitum]|uniref:uncharacterized protein n=1 Tax=Penicillium solitum TaxID=60172 RepID=UPI0032C3DDCF|nr:hypothetical protein N7536_011664 [Penicillium majusculum]KAJ5857487.1 hypothetical protein N7455_008381 [Penicillium solitum]